MKKSLNLILLACLLVGCSVTTRPGVSPTHSQSHPAQSQVKPVRINHISHQMASPEIMLYSMSLVGMPYQFGGSDRQAGFDCSGLVLDVYQNSVHTALPRTANDMAYAGIPINKEQLQVGDLVFFNTNGQSYSHVGIFLGDNRFLHSPNSKSQVKIGTLDNPYWGKQFSGARTYFVK